MKRKSAEELKFISLEERTQPRLRFVRVDIDLQSDDRFVVRIDLEQHAGEIHPGTVAAKGRGKARIPAAALAAIKALRSAVGISEANLQMLDTGTVRVFDTPAIVVSMAAHVGNEVQKLVGFCVAEEELPERAAALAVLNGVNRFLGAVVVEDGGFRWKLSGRHA